jgi:TatD DNase family protein
MILHSRAASKDFYDIVKANRDKFSQGVVHCFTGSTEEMQDLLDLDLYVGLTCLSFRTEDQLETIKQIPLDKIVVATDAPFCMSKEDFAGHQYIETYF